MKPLSFTAWLACGRVALLVIGSCVAGLGSGSAFADPSAALAEAELMAARDQKAAAIDAYQQVLKSKPHLAEAQYNLGTLQLEAGHLGAATVSLLRARYLDPGLEDVAFQLAAARAATGDAALSVGPGRSWWTRVGEALSPRPLAAGYLALLLLFATAIVASTLVPRRRRALLLVTGLLFAAANVLLWARLDVESTPVWVLTSESADAFKAPQAGAATSFEVHEGVSGRVIETRGGFVRLRLDNGVDAWFADEGFVQATPLPEA